MGLLVNSPMAPYMGATDYELFRTRLALRAGIDLDEMEGFGGNKPWDQVTDDIKLFLNHPEYDCLLSAHDCERIAPRLVELIGSWLLSDPDRRRGELFAAALVDKAKHGESLQLHMAWRGSGPVPFTPTNIEIDDQLAM